MNDNRQSAHSYFQSLMQLVVGQAYTSAGYLLEERPLQWAGGMYRWQKELEDAVIAIIDYQALVHTLTEHVPSQPSRFRITLTRTPAKHPKPTAHPRYASRTLSQLVVEDFGVAILPNASYWWTYTDTHSLGQALAESGHLVIGYGMGWLDGTLSPS